MTYFQVVANNVTVVQFSDLGMAAYPVEPNGSLRWRAHTSLSHMCQAVWATLGHPLSEDLTLALLLSAASAGVPVSTPTQTNDAAIRNQV